MRRFSSKLGGQQSGFTLIELVIVIVIIGILAAAAIPLFSGVTDDAFRSKADAVVASINSAVQAQKALCQNPNKPTGLCPATYSCSSIGADTSTTSPIRLAQTIAATAGTNNFTCVDGPPGKIVYNRTATESFTSSADIKW